MANGDLSNGSADDALEELHSPDDNSFSIDDGEALFIEDGDANAARGRKKNLLKRIVIAGVIILVAVSLFFLGGILGAGQKIATINPTAIQSENNNQLVYVTGTPQPKEYKDPVFNVTATGLGLVRVVEMYQWVQENNKYIKKYTEELVKITEEGAISEGFVNPTDMPFLSEKFLADKITIGSFTIDPELTKLITAAEPLALNADNFKMLHPEAQLAFKLDEGGYFFGANPKKLNIGDFRINFKTYPASAVSILAKQVGDTLVPFVGEQGTIAVVRPGIVSLDNMIEGQNLGGSIVVNVSLRAMAFLLLMSGIFVVLGKVPFIGKKRNHVDIQQKKKPKSKKRKAAEEDNVEELNIEEAEPQLNETPMQHDTGDFETTIPERFVESASYVDPIKVAAAPQSSIPARGVSAVPVIASAPVALEFTPSADVADNTSDITSQLQQFGIIGSTNNTNSIQSDIAPTDNFAESDMPAPEPYQAEVINSNNNYASSNFDVGMAEEMPFEVELLSEDMPDTIHAAPMQPDQTTNYTTTTLPQTEEITADDAYTENRHMSQDMEIPEGVELIAEDAMPIESHENAAQPMNLNIVDEPIGLDFYPELQDNVSLEPLPPLPDFDAIFAERNNIIENQDNNDENQEEDTATNTTEDAYDAIANEELLLPPLPDFDSLMAKPISSTPNTAATSQESIFSLPDITQDFDPTVEMTAPATYSDETDNDDDNSEVVDEDAHSPFGDDVIDPFAVPEEKQ